MKFQFFIQIFITFLFISCKSLSIEDTPIVFDDERKELTIEYLENHYGIEQNSVIIKPQMIVVHWTAIPTLKKSFDAFYSSRLPQWRPDLKNVSALNVSSQFLVDQDGTIYRLMPENYMARHVIGLNHCAIGIENVGGIEGLPLTEEQLDSNIKLINYLKKKYPEIEYVIGHFEYTNFENHELWLEKDANYRTKKIDPGVDFINSIRESTSNHNWKPIPKLK